MRRNKLLQAFWHFSEDVYQCSRSTWSLWVRGFSGIRFKDYIFATLLLSWRIWTLQLTSTSNEEGKVWWQGTRTNPPQNDRADWNASDICKTDTWMLKSTEVLRMSRMTPTLNFQSLTHITTRCWFIHVLQQVSWRSWMDLRKKVQRMSQTWWAKCVNYQENRTFFGERGKVIVQNNCFKYFASIDY